MRSGMQLLCLQMLCLQLHCSLLLLRHVMQCSTFCPCSAAKANRRSVALIPRRLLPLLICCAAFTAAAAISVLEISRCSGYCFGTAAARLLRQRPVEVAQRLLVPVVVRVVVVESPLLLKQLEGF